MKISAIVFDLGGVYFSNGTKKVIELIHKNYAVSKSILTDIYCGEKSWDLRINKISSYDYWEYIYNKYPNLSNIDFKNLWYEAFTLNSDINHMVKALAERYCLGIISGNISDRISHLEKKYNFEHFFTFKIYTFNTGIHKNNKELYTILSAQLKALKIPAHETVFIDDNEDCLQAASRVGIKTILFKDDYAYLQQQLLAFGVNIPAIPQNNFNSKNLEIDYQSLKIMEYPYWQLYLHSNQNYLGRMYLLARYDKDRDFSELTEGEIEEFFYISKTIKNTLYSLFQPDVLNYSSLCNVYKKLHIHFIPRYKDKRYFKTLEFIDKRWGMNYSPYDYEHKISNECLFAIRDAIKDALLLN